VHVIVIKIVQNHRAYDQKIMNLYKISISGFKSSTDRLHTEGCQLMMRANLVTAKSDKKAVLLHGNCAMPQLFLSVKSSPTFSTNVE